MSATVFYVDDPLRDFVRTRELPLVVGVLAKLSGSRTDVPHLRARRFVKLTCENFEEVLSATEPTLCCPVANRLGDGDLPPFRIYLSFRSLDDFDPAMVARQIKPLRELLQRREDLANLLAILSSELEACLAPLMDEAGTGGSGAVDEGRIRSALGTTELWETEDEAAYAASIAKALLDEVAEGTMVAGSGLVTQITRRIEFLDQLLTKQLQEVVALEEFERLCQTWFGLHRLVTAVRGCGVTVRVLDVSAQELCRDLAMQEIGASKVGWLMGDGELRSFGGEPFSILVFDHLFTRHPEEMDLLERLACLCAANSSLLVSGVSPRFFGLTDFGSLPAVSDLDRMLSSDWYSLWNAFRSAECATWTVLTLPTAAVPTFPAGTARHSSRYSFKPEPDVERTFPGNACWQVAAKLVAHVAGMSGSLPGPADGLSATWPEATRQAVESCGFCLPDGRAEEMTVVISRASRTFALDVLLAGRISHYSSAMIREKSESFLSAADWQGYFENWVKYYVVPWRHGTSPSEFAYAVTVGRKVQSPLGTLDLTITISAFDDPQYLRVTQPLTSWRLLNNAVAAAET